MESAEEGEVIIDIPGDLLPVKVLQLQIGYCSIWQIRMIWHRQSNKVIHSCLLRLINENAKNALSLGNV